MKPATLIIFGMMLVAATCLPANSDLKAIKAQAARNMACLKDCSTVPIQPICASKPGDRPKSFGNVCVMNNHNCEHNDILQKVSNGACSNSDEIRLS